MEDKKILNIYQRLDQARVEIGIVKKNIDVMNSYKAVSETDILKAVNEAEHKVGLYSYMQNLEILDAQIVNGFNYIRVKVTVEIINIDKPEEKLIVYGLGDGLDKGDKTCGKAVTYAMKYALMKGYKIPSGEDPDYFKSAEDKEPLATEEQIKTYISLIGGESQVTHICEKLGVADLHELTQKRLQNGIELRQEQLKNKKKKSEVKDGDKE